MSTSTKNSPFRFVRFENLTPNDVSLTYWMEGHKELVETPVFPPIYRTVAAGWKTVTIPGMAVGTDSDVNIDHASKVVEIPYAGKGQPAGLPEHGRITLSFRMNPGDAPVVSHNYFFFKAGTDYENPDLAPKGLYRYDVETGETQVVGALDRDLKNKTLTGKIDFRASSAPQDGIYIGEVLVDPIPEDTIHSIQCASSGFSADELPLTLVSPLRAGGTGTFTFDEGQAQMVETLPLPVVKKVEAIFSGSVKPVPLAIKLADGGTTILNCFYLETWPQSKDNPRYTFYYYPNEDTAALQSPFYWHKDDRNFEVIQVHLAKADPTQEDFEGVRIEKITTSQNPHFEQEMPAPGEATGYRKDGEMHYLKGRVVDANGKPRPGLEVTVMDKDLITKDDFLGKAITDAQGYFQVNWNEKAHKAWFFDKKPDLYFEVTQPASLLLSTQDSPLKNAKPSDDPIILTIK